MMTVNLALSEYYNLDGDLVVYASVRKQFQAPSGRMAYEEIEFVKFEDLEPAKYGTLYLDKHVDRGRNGRIPGVILRAGDRYAMVELGKRISFRSEKGGILTGELIGYHQGRITIRLSTDDCRTYDHRSFCVLDPTESTLGKKQIVV